MWISNTATTTMMMPMVEAVIQELRRGEKIQQQEQQENGLLEKEVDNKGIDNKIHPIVEAVRSNSIKSDIIINDIKSVNSIKSAKSQQLDETASETQMVTNHEETEDDTSSDSAQLSIVKVALMICV